MHGFGQKFEIFLTFRFMQIQPEKVFGDVLVRKQAFVDNIKMERRRNWHFYKGDSP